MHHAYLFDTDIFIDAAHSIEDAVNCLQQIEEKSWAADSRCPHRSNSHCYQHPIELKKSERLQVYC
jgi:hypothetical protein